MSNNDCFVDMVNVRDGLAFKKMKVELTKTETIILERLNNIIEKILPEPKGLPKEINELVDKILKNKK